MAHFVVYQASTGRVLRAGECDPWLVQRQAIEPDERAMAHALGRIDPNKWRVDNGALVAISGN